MSSKGKDEVGISTRLGVVFTYLLLVGYIWSTVSRFARQPDNTLLWYGSSNNWFMLIVSVVKILHPKVYWKPFSEYLISHEVVGVPLKLLDNLLLLVSGGVIADIFLYWILDMGSYVLREALMIDWTNFYSLIQVGSSLRSLLPQTSYSDILFGLCLGSFTYTYFVSFQVGNVYFSADSDRVRRWNENLSYVQIAPLRHIHYVINIWQSLTINLRGPVLPLSYLMIFMLHYHSETFSKKYFDWCVRSKHMSVNGKQPGQGAREEVAKLNIIWLSGGLLFSLLYLYWIPKRIQKWSYFWHVIINFFYQIWVIKYYLVGGVSSIRFRDTDRSTFLRAYSYKFHLES